MKDEEELLGQEVSLAWSSRSWENHLQWPNEGSTDIISKKCEKN